MKNPNDVFYYLKSRSAESLKNLMIQNNIKRNMYFSYKIIYAEGFWYAWFEAPMDEALMEAYDNINGRKGQRSQEV
jgi:hypothetical protein